MKRPRRPNAFRRYLEANYDAEVAKKRAHPAAAKIAKKKLAKRVASKKTKPVKRKKVSLAFNKIQAGCPPLPWTAEDAAIFDIPNPPSGFAYQWSPFSRIEYMRSKGWSQVPFSRHPEMAQSTNFDGYIVYRGMALFQISADIVKEALAAMRNTAQAQGQLSSLRMSGDYDAGFGSIMPEEWIVSEPLPDAEPLTETELTIKFMMPKSWSGAAATCRLDLAEYVRRRLLQDQHFLASDGGDGIYYIVELTTKKVEV